MAPHIPPRLPPVATQNLCGGGSCELLICNLRTGLRYIFFALICWCRHKPIQLLRPRGLCSVVCPILISPTLPLAPPSLSIAVSIAIGGISIASATGLGDMSGVERAESHESRLSPCARLSSELARTDVVPGTGRNASAYHSYQTCRWFVRRQIETCSSELLGR